MTEEKSKFLFSIIVPVYNTEKYVEKTLKSIYEAMDRDCEVIVVNEQRMVERWICTVWLWIRSRKIYI